MRFVIVVACVLAASSFCSAQAQTPPAGTAPAAAPTIAPPTGQKSLAATLNVYVFPSNGQTSSQQSKDEGDCYNWAVQNTGSDPFQAQQQGAQQTQAANQASAQQTTAFKKAFSACLEGKKYTVKY